MNDEQIKYMINRFLGWRLPDDFGPDGGITFNSEYLGLNGQPKRHEPTGTNLLTATQAEAMIRYMIHGMPSE